MRLGRDSRQWSWRSVSLGIAVRARRPDAGPVRARIAIGRTRVLGPAVGNDILRARPLSAALIMVRAATWHFA
jgi:hypothetical protein